MADATTHVPATDSLPESNEVSTEATNTLTVDEEEQSAQLPLRLPLELLSDISERVLSEHASWCLEKSEAGEPLSKIWTRVKSSNNLDNYDNDAQWMISSPPCRFDLDSACTERYIYRPGVPALLLLNKTMRAEGLDAYLKRTKAQIAEYEDQQTVAEAKYSCLRWILSASESEFLLLRGGQDAMEKLEKRIQRMSREMVERCLRWYVLKESSRQLGAWHVRDRSKLSFGQAEQILMREFDDLVDQQTA